MLKVLYGLSGPPSPAPCGGRPSSTTRSLREWLVINGGRHAEQRIAHLRCELPQRVETVGLTNGSQYELPITQTEFGDTLSLSLVHVNRVLQRLRKNELITLADGRLVILDTRRS
jgi:CRP-like cAMP-binding protein